MAHLENTVGSLYRTVIAVLWVGVATGCALVATKPHQAGADLDTWLRGSAAPAIRRALETQGERGAIIVEARADPAGTSGPAAREVARRLTTILREQGLSAMPGSESRKIRFSEAVCSGAVEPPVTITVKADAGSATSKYADEVEVTLLAGEPSSGSVVVLATGRVAVPSRAIAESPGSGQAELQLGSVEAPYAAVALDRLLEDLADRLRCDLLRVRWRTGMPEVRWDTARPSEWYRSFGLRLRDELMRRDGVLGAPGSSVVAQSIDLRLEPAGSGGVMRLVARITARPEADHEGVLWHQRYLLTPGPAGGPLAAATEAVSPPEPAPVLPAPSPPASPAPPPVIAQPTPNRVDSSPAARRANAAIAAVRVLRPATAAQCRIDDPWRAGAVAVPTVGGLMTGDCIAFEVSGLRAEEFYVLHEASDGQMTRLFPSACIPEEIVPSTVAPLRIPATTSPGRAVQLTEPPGIETFHFVAIAPTELETWRSRLGALPDVCAPADVPRAGDRVTTVGRLLRDAEQLGHVAVQALRVTHRLR